MEKKRYIKAFNSQADYEAQKDAVMGVPHVVLLEDIDDIIFESLNETEEDDIDYSLEFFTLEAINNGEVIFTLGSDVIDNNELYYSINGGEWQTAKVEGGEGQDFTIASLSSNDRISFKANTSLVNGNGGFGTLKIDESFNAYGNIMSLLYGDDFQGQISLEGRQQPFYKLFKNSMIVSAENLILPATTLANSCYQDMFSGCKLLTTAPQLLATTLASSCYSNMFQGCSNLNKITMLATNISASGCLYNWVSGVAQEGTFIKDATMTELKVNNTSGIPSGWTVKNYEK